MSLEKEEKAAVCSSCGAHFTCGMEAGQTTCWCMEKPAVFPAPEGDGKCFCPACLDKMLKASSCPEA